MDPLLLASCLLARMGEPVGEQRGAAAQLGAQLGDLTPQAYAAAENLAIEIRCPEKILSFFAKTAPRIWLLLAEAAGRSEALCETAKCGSAISLDDYV